MTSETLRPYTFNPKASSVEFSSLSPAPHPDTKPPRLLPQEGFARVRLDYGFYYLGFPKIGVPYFGVLIIRILLFRVLY